MKTLPNQSIIPLPCVCLERTSKRIRPPKIELVVTLVSISCESCGRLVLRACKKNPDIAVAEWNRMYGYEPTRNSQLLYKGKKHVKEEAE